MLKFAERPIETAAVSPAALDQLFREARTHNAFLDKPVPEALLREAVEIAQWGPTSANTLPMRIVFVRGKEAKEKLKPALMGANVDKTMAAPLTAIVGYDVNFFEHAPKLMPHMDIRPWFAGNEAFAERTAFQNGTLQAGYLILALRAVGLDTGPDASGLRQCRRGRRLFRGHDGEVELSSINIGYGDPDKLFPRNPRLYLRRDRPHRLTSSFSGACPLPSAVLAGCRIASPARHPVSFSPPPLRNPRHFAQDRVSAQPAAGRAARLVERTGDLFRLIRDAGFWRCNRLRAR